MRIQDLPHVNGAVHPGAAAAPPDQVLLDVRPIKEPVSPFDWMIRQLKSADYANAEEAQQAAQVVGWFEHLRKSCPRITSTDPIFLAAVSHAATDGKFRKELRRALEEVDKTIAQAAQA